MESAGALDPLGIILLAGPFSRDMAKLADTIMCAGRTLVWMKTCADAIRCARERPVEVVLSARTLPDGDWTLLLWGLAALRQRPPVIVLSQDRGPGFRLETISLEASS